jgi:hypothetical protein
VCRFDAHRRVREKLVQLGGRGELASRYGRLRSVLLLVSLRTAAAAAAAAASCFAAPSCWTR